MVMALDPTAYCNAMQETHRFFAHSVTGRPVSEWEPLADHLTDVAHLAADFARPFGLSESGRVVGKLHDIGKSSCEYQAYIASPDGERKARGPDHSTAGAREAAAAYPGQPGRMLACIIAGHHAGLGDGDEISRRLTPDHRIPAYDGWQAHAGALPPASALKPQRSFDPGRHPGFAPAFLTRMLFSCLVDADFLATEAFIAGAEGRVVERGGHAGLDTLRDRLRAHMAGLGDGGAAPAVHALRRRVLEYAIARAGLEPGLFTLTVPTGGGKTLASLSFALEHALRHGLRRVVYVIPFTSIIEQTAAVFRDVLGGENVVEHHASFDWDTVAKGDEDAPGDAHGKLRRAAENWDAPVIVTTAVQFFESLFANRPSRCRKLHNLAGAVIVLDEAQTMPLNLLRPCLAALEELAANYGASVLLCTATQPALLERDGFPKGLRIPPERELAPDPAGLYAALKRVRVEVLPEPVEDATIAARFAEAPQMLCIVNSRAHARALFEAIRDLPGAAHLTTLMCPLHRRKALEKLRPRLRAGEPVRLVATSLIEAGVDISFPEVWRAETGLDSVAQAAGRCNRNGEREMGRVVVFTPAEAKPPRALVAFAESARQVRRAHEDLLGLDAIRAYFQEVYWRKGDEALDAAMVDGRPGVLKALAERDGDVPFRGIADAFRVIEDTMDPVVVPWDETARTLLREIAAVERPLRGHLRRLQQYVVSIPRPVRMTWLEGGALVPVHPGLGDALLAVADTGRYRCATGLDLDAPGLRPAEDNVW